MTSDEFQTEGEAASKSVIRLVAILEEEDMISEEQREDILEPIYEFVNQYDFEEFDK